ncbi:hypothetical protein CPB83DRAFT_864146 [Crepidotus variabilis]|uniref:Uncharacterized protein n=1 Tax=Crepidotus variabilis TaxID=179855 RepID=A0A9P6JIT9_9AGAR|nr:hypothetical protein CPB83DRAFT_864146 [Crepidotus variabilis]
MPNSRPGASSQAQDIDVEAADHEPSSRSHGNGKSSVRSKRRHHEAYATTSNLHPFWSTKRGLATIAFVILIIVGAIVGGVVGGTVGRSPDHKLPSKSTPSGSSSISRTTATSNTAGSSAVPSASTTLTDSAVSASISA